VNAELLATWSDPAAAWILTFAIHSTVLLGTAWLILATFRKLQDSCAETLWKVACLGAVLTASCQLTLVGEPFAGHVARIGASAIDPPLPAGAPTSQGQPVLPPAAQGNAAAPSDSGRAAFEVGSSPVTWSSWLLSLALLAAGFGSIHGLCIGRHTRRLLDGRVPLGDGPALAMLGRLCARVGYGRSLRLSEHPRLQTPIAFGALRPEICLPEHGFGKLDEAQQQSMLAHELGHLVRRDPLWLRVNSLLVALFPWQPLFRLARRRIQVLAEFRSDALAADLTGNLDAAGCLLEVASWVATSQQTMHLSVTGMALRSSTLKLRIDRLLCGDSPRALGRHRLWLLPLSAALLTLATTALPGAGLRRSEAALAEPTLHLSASHDSTVDLLEMLITQMDLEFTELRREVEQLRAELAVGPQKPELTSMLAELDSRLASLERHRELFGEVLEEWAGSDTSK